MQLKKEFVSSLYLLSDATISSKSFYHVSDLIAKAESLIKWEETNSVPFGIFSVYNKSLNDIITAIGIFINGSLR